MGIKDKVKRASKIFTSDSKENLTEVTADASPSETKEATATEGEVAEPEAVPETEAVADEPVATEATEPVEATEATETTETPAEATETVEPTVADEAEPVAEEAANAEPETDKGEDAIAEVKKSSTTKEVKKTDFFKKLLLKFKKTPAATA